MGVDEWRAGNGELSPGEDRLFELIDARVATGEDLTELIDHGTGWRVQGGSTDVHADDAAIALGNGVETD